MQDAIFKIIGHYLEGKSIYTPVRRAISLLFSLSVSSYLYTWCYGHYDWLDITDYKGILDFFVKGYFVLPLFIFLGIQLFLMIIPEFLFRVINQRSQARWRREVNSIELSRSELESMVETINAKTEELYGAKLSGEQLIQYIGAAKNDFKETDWDVLIESLDIIKKDILKNFQTSFLALIAVIIYYFSIPFVGWVFLTLIVIGIIGFMVTLTFAYRFLDVLPDTIKKSLDLYKRKIEEQPEKTLKIILKK